MNRRGFLKILGTATAALALPVAGATKLLDFEAPVPAGLTTLGHIREVFAFDVETCWVFVRFDVLTDDLQWGVDMRYSSQAECNAHLPQAREIAKQLFEDKMTSNGKTWADLRPLPIPPGYERPAWVTA